MVRRRDVWIFVALVVAALSSAPQLNLSPDERLLPGPITVFFGIIALFVAPVMALGGQVFVRAHISVGLPWNLQLRCWGMGGSIALTGTLMELAFQRASGDMATLCLALLVFTIAGFAVVLFIKVLDLLPQSHSVQEHRWTGPEPAISKLVELPIVQLEIRQAGLKSIYRNTDPKGLPEYKELERALIVKRLDERFSRISLADYQAALMSNELIELPRYACIHQERGGNALSMLVEIDSRDVYSFRLQWLTVPKAALEAWVRQAQVAMIEQIQRGQPAQRMSCCLELEPEFPEQLLQEVRARIQHEAANFDYVLLLVEPAAWKLSTRIVIDRSNNISSTVCKLTVTPQSERIVAIGCKENYWFKIAEIDPEPL